MFKIDRAIVAVALLAAASPCAAQSSPTTYGARLTGAPDPDQTLNTRRVNNRINNRINNRLSLRVERYRSPAADPLSAIREQARGTTDAFRSAADAGRQGSLATRPLPQPTADPYADEATAAAPR